MNSNDDYFYPGNEDEPQGAEEKITHLTALLDKSIAINVRLNDENVLLLTQREELSRQNSALAGQLQSMLANALWIALDERRVIRASGIVELAEGVPVTAKDGQGSRATRSWSHRPLIVNGERIERPYWSFHELSQQLAPEPLRPNRPGTLEPMPEAEIPSPSSASLY